MSSVEIENRLKAIETELASLKARANGLPHSHPVHAIEKIHGTFENDPALKQAMQLGRKWRQSDPPRARKSRARPQ